LHDLGFVRLRDLASPERVYQLMHAKLRKDFPALRSLEATPSNLPQQVTSFVGRERELAEVKSLLGKARLLTVFGVGGIGKTRLSLQVAADVMDDYPDGVWFVELAGLTDAQLVVPAVASVFGVKEAAGRALLEDVIGHVQARKQLLILDNCEHLVQACAELAKHLLRAGSELKILASSREPLHTEGETSWQLPPLSIPDLNQSLGPAALAQYEAVRLFTDRAAAVQPAFQLSEGNAEAVSVICHRLDGIPLALETRCRPRAHDVGGADHNAPRRPPPILDGRLSNCHAAPADITRFDRLELRPAGDAGAHAFAPAGRVCRRLYARRGGSRGWRRRKRRHGRAGTPLQPGGEVASGLEWRWRAVPAPGDGQAVCARKA
jgi:hypothetical protein